MRRNRRRPSFNEEAETKKMIYISIAVVIIAILTFVITYVVYSNALSKKSTGDLSRITELSSTKNEQVSEASSSIGKTVNEVTEEESKNEVNKIAINTSNIEQANKETTEEKVNESTNIETQQTAVNQETKKEEKVPDPTFIKPVEGDIIREFAKDSLVYSETLKEWVTHTGIDIKAEKTTVVKASSD